MTGVDPMAEAVDRLLGGFAGPNPAGAPEPSILRAGEWDAVCAMGLPLALVSEAKGGVGLGWPEALPLLHAVGRHAALLPLGETMLANWLLQRAGLAPEAGPLAVVSDGAWSLTRADGGWRLAGEAPRVPWARLATRLIVVVEDRLAIVDPGRARIVPGANLAGEPRDHVAVDAALPQSCVATIEDPRPGEDLLCLGAAIRASAMAGALARILALTVAYAGDRIQFGRPLAGFQVIQHNIARIAGEAAAGGAAAAIAAAAPLDPILVGAAKVRAGEAAGIAAALAHQVHGAIGFTHEHDLQRFTRRLWAWRDECGSEAFWSARIGKALVPAGREGLWPALTAGGR